jgi:hypothetical protein
VRVNCDWRRAARGGGDAIKSVLDKTKDDRSKNRGTFHCLLAEASGTLGKLS